MLKQRLPALFAMMLAGLILGGCSSTNEEPAETPVEPEQPVYVPPPVEEEAKDFDPTTGQPLDPRTGKLLDRTFYFAYDQSVLRQADLAVLEIHAQILRNNPDRSVVIEGHCDERGTREYNLALGERRSDAVRSFLTSSGVASRQIETVSYGEERPEDPGHDESAWSRNRRAIMTYR